MLLIQISWKLCLLSTRMRLDNKRARDVTWHYDQMRLIGGVNHSRNVLPFSGRTNRVPWGRRSRMSSG